MNIDLIECTLPDKREQFHYRILGHMAGMTTMIIEATSLKDNSVIYYSLGQPNYFEGTFTWLGSGLYVAFVDELITLIDYLYPHLPIEAREDHQKLLLLLKSKTNYGNEIKFLVSYIRSNHELRPDFHRLADVKQ